MIIVMKSGCSTEHVRHVVELLRDRALKAHVSQGTDRTIIGAIGDRRHADMTAIENAPMVDRLVPILAPYKLASNEVRAAPSVVSLGNNVFVGGKRTAVLLTGRFYQSDNIAPAQRLAKSTSRLLPAPFVSTMPAKEVFGAVPGTAGAPVNELDRTYRDCTSYGQARKVKARAPR